MRFKDMRRGFAAHEKTHVLWGGELTVGFLDQAETCHLAKFAESTNEQKLDSLGAKPQVLVLCRNEID